MIWMFPVVVLAGLYLPGSLVARRLGDPLWFASGFVVSLLVLFHVIFWLELFHVSIQLRIMFPALLVISAAVAWWARKSLRPALSAPATRWDTHDIILIGGSAAVGIALAVRAALAPLLGFDTTYRWDFLAEKILALGTYSYYPPLTPADFRTYFYVDGIPPLVSFTNWWIYAAAGKHAPALLSIVVAAQFACTLTFAYGAAAALYSRRAGALAAAILAACPLYFDAVVIEQETGVTALGIAAMIYFLVRHRPGGNASLILGGLGAACCALAREYGWIAVIGGGVVLLWRRFPRRDAVLFGAAAAGVAGPWYIRDWILSGNPFYSLHFGPFAVNPVHDGIMSFYEKTVSPSRWTPDTVAALVGFLLTMAPLQLFAGIPAAWAGFRQRGYLAALTLFLALVWFQSIRYTSGGLEASTRVLSPAAAVLSILAAGNLVRWRSPAMVVILLCQGWTMVQGSVYPQPISTWPEAAFRPVLKPAEFQIAGQLAAALPPGTRILTDSAYLHAAMAGKDIDVVPVWSPEVRFLFSVPDGEADARVESLGIRTVVFYTRSMNSRYLIDNSPFYRTLEQRWRVLAEIEGLAKIMQR